MVPKVGRIFFAGILEHFRVFPLGKFHSGILSGTDKSACFFRVWVTVWVRTENQRRRICAAVNKEYLYILTIFPGSLREPERAVLQNPFLRRIVDIDQADALGIAAVPLKIVGRRPVEKLWTSAWSHPLRSASR